MRVWNQVKRAPYCLFNFCAFLCRQQFVKGSLVFSLGDQPSVGYQGFHVTFYAGHNFSVRLTSSLTRNGQYWCCNEVSLIFTWKCSTFSCVHWIKISILCDYLGWLGALNRTRKERSILSSNLMRPSGSRNGGKLYNVEVFRIDYFFFW